MGAALPPAICRTTEDAMKLFDDVLEAEVDLDDPFWRAASAVTVTPDVAKPADQPRMTSDEVLWVILLDE